MKQTLRELVAEALSEKARAFLSMPEFGGVSMSEEGPRSFGAKLLFHDAIPADLHAPAKWTFEFPGYGPIEVPVAAEVAQPMVFGR